MNIVTKFVIPLLVVVGLIAGLLWYKKSQEAPATYTPGAPSSAPSAPADPWANLKTN